ncbi:hypothetical protein POM88_054974 [Heracleum sosnowskyi]|uniref:Replication protein A OB domain-containing protein n=1 Tax=Heracleum sosnowskyi TaxID=360622 RepID=A0AAD8GMP9_9APIA|nr:hypothetical protein POM88_054974 [Heracleum sosnowskyi]
MLNNKDNVFCLPTNGSTALLSPLTRLNVVGIIKSNFKSINKLHNRLGKDQCQAKFTITDGKSNIKVTFWDRYAEFFAKTMSETVETPVIIIIATCKVGLWNDEVDISNVGATKFYLNYNHHMLAADDTGGIKIILGDQQVRMLIGKRARQLVDTEGSAKEFPLILKELANKDYTIKLRIKELNILHKNEVYCATNICNGFKLEEVHTTYYNDEMIETATQVNLKLEISIV